MNKIGFHVVFDTTMVEDCLCWIDARVATNPQPHAESSLGMPENRLGRVLAHGLGFLRVLQPLAS